MNSRSVGFLSARPLMAGGLLEVSTKDCTEYVFQEAAELTKVMRETGMEPDLLVSKESPFFLLLLI